MNDRELIELAAEAVGYPLSWMTNGKAAFHGDEIWDPLADDTDAFRLAVNIGLIVNPPSPIGEYAVVRFYDIDVWEPVAGCRYAATRRAITRAAAQIGKGK